MPLDSRYVIAPSLQMYFVNKDTGLPLANGKVFFYVDNTSIPKDVFTIEAAGSDFTYTVLPNPSTLSAVGTFQNGSGVDILPYYFPYDADGNIQLYRVEVYDSNLVLQFTRVGWPNLTSDIIRGGEDVTNFVPNGQFLLHNNIPASSSNNFTPGLISSDTTILAQGGWSFVRSSGSGSTDIVTFPRYNSPVEIPTGNPRYAVQIQTTVVGSTTRRDLCLKFPDVNTFASTTQQYNFYFEGEAISGSDIQNVQIIIHKYFGSGGSTETFTNVATITLLANQIKKYTTPILFGINTTKNIGPNDDDYVEIIIRLPIAAVQTALFTNFALTIGQEVLTSFPQQTEAQQIGASTAGWLPEPSPGGLDLYLPSILTPTGMTFDRSQIGQVIADGNLTKYSGSLSTITNSMIADGSQYRYNDYSTLGIPFSRLGDYYINGGTAGVPQFGTGDNFVTNYIETGGAQGQKLIFTFNKIQTPVAPADGATPTNFIFKPLIASTTGFDFVAYTNGTTLVTAIANTPGNNVSPPASGTSGMTIVSYRNEILTYQIIQITALSAAALGNGAGTGKYFDFSNTTIQYRMWFKTATETPPAAGGRTLIELDLDLTMDANDVAKVIANAMAGFQEYQITCGAASTFNNGAYFTFTSNSQIYVPYYIKDNINVPPAVSNSILISINVASSATNIQVASATQLALNRFYFKVPNLIGLFLRGYDPTGEWDIDYLNRFSISDTLLGSSPGTMEIDQIYSHRHSVTSNIQYSGASTSTGDLTLNTGGNFTTKTNSGTATNTGGSESRPVNMSVVWAIKY